MQRTCSAVRWIRTRTSSRSRSKMRQAPVRPPPLRSSRLLFTECLNSARVTIPSVTRYIRYSNASGVSYGILDGDIVRALPGGLFDSPEPTGVTHKLSDVKLLA